MKKIIYIFILLFSTLTLYSQKWDATFGTSNHDENEEDIIECYDHGYIVTGNHYLSNGGMWVIKTDFNGELLWEKNIIHNQYEIIKGAIDQNSSGQIALARCINVGNGAQWPVVIKLDSCGNKQWCRVLIDYDFTHGCLNDVMIFDNGDVLCLGWMESDQEIDKIFLYYLDANGNLVWRESYASKTDHPLVMERLPLHIKKCNDLFIITGWCYYPHPQNPSVGSKRPFYIGVDSVFDEKWILPFGVEDFIYGEARDVIPIDESVFMGVGFKWETGSVPISLYMFFNQDGEELSYNVIPNEQIGPGILKNIASSLARVNDSLFIVSTWYGDQQYGNPFGEFIVDTACNIYKKEIRPNTEGRSNLIKTFDNKYVIGCTYEHPNGNEDIYLYKINDSLQMDTVYPGTYNYDSLCPYQIESGVIDVTGCLFITDVGETPTPEEYFASLNTIRIKALPNPTNTGSIKLQYSNTEHHSNIELRCFNIHGEEIHSERIYRHQGESLIDVGDWPNGMYLAIVYSENRPVGKTKFIVR